MIKITELLETENNLSLIKTNKYKDINVSIRCAFEYDTKLSASLLVLSALLQEQCEKYPSKEEMSKAKDMLYGLSFDAIVGNVGSLLTLNLSYSFTNPKFLKSVSQNDYIDFIDTTLMYPLLNEKVFQECKRVIIDILNRKLDKPSSFALNNFYKEVSEDDNRFASYIEPDTSSIESLVLEDIKDAYNELFNNRVDIFLIGDYDDSLKDYLKKYSSKKELKTIVKPLDLVPKKEINIKKEVGQSTLIVSYKHNFVRSDDDYYAYFLGNVMFGGIPSSLLFSEVREKDNLCYVISSRPLKYEGLLYVSTLIDSKNKDKALLDIRKQFKRLVEGDYDPSLLETAKTMLITNSLTIDDDLDYLMNFYYNSALTGVKENVDEFIRKLNNVTLADIKRVYSSFEEYLVYFLEGTTHA